MAAFFPFVFRILMTSLCSPAGLPAVPTVRVTINSPGHRAVSQPGFSHGELATHWGHALATIPVWGRDSLLTTCPCTATTRQCFDLSGCLQPHLEALGPLSILITSATFQFSAAATGRLLDGLRGRGVGAGGGWGVGRLLKAVP